MLMTIDGEVDVTKMKNLRAMSMNTKHENGRQSAYTFNLHHD